MNGDMEALARALMAAAQGSGKMPRMDELAALLQSPQGQRAVSMLSQSGMSDIKAAANAALGGDERSSKAALAKFLATPEGAALVRALAASMGRRD